MAIVEIAKNYTALIDDEDIELISQHRWRVHKTHGREIPRALTNVNGNKKNRYMHQIILRPKPDEFVCHRDGDFFNNRRNNLFIMPLSKRQWARLNPQNEGLILIGGKWIGRICFKRRTYELKACLNKNEARKARNYVAWRLRGPITHLSEKDFENYNPKLLTPSILRLLDRET